MNLLMAIFQGHIRPKVLLGYVLVFWFASFCIGVIMPGMGWVLFPVRFALGYGLVASTFEFNNDPLVWRVLAWVVAFLLIGMFAFVRI